MSLKPEILSSQSSEIYPSTTGEVPVLIWIADKTGTIQFVEGEIQEFVDLKLKKSIGKSFRDIFRDFAVVIEGAEKAIQGEGSKLVSSIGSRLWEWQFIPRRGRRKSEPG